MRSVGWSQFGLEQRRPWLNYSIPERQSLLHLLDARIVSCSWVFFPLDFHSPVFSPLLGFLSLSRGDVWLYAWRHVASAICSCFPPQELHWCQWTSCRLLHTSLYFSLARGCGSLASSPYRMSLGMWPLTWPSQRSRSWLQRADMLEMLACSNCLLLHTPSFQEVFWIWCRQRK